MSVDLQVKLLRTLSRKNFKNIIDYVIQTNISRNTSKQKSYDKDICMFCGATENITKEHVIPLWTFEHNDRKVFTTHINGLDQTYNKTTIPACSKCNNVRLNSLEVYIKKLFASIDLNARHFNNEEMGNIIRWLEIIDYKFQILNARRRFIKHKESGFIPYLSNFPLSVLRPNVESPSKVVTQIRRSFKRVTIKNKDSNLNSLIIFKTSNPDFHFFHTMDDFIFIELPRHKLALFYFYKKNFRTIKAGHKEAKKIIDSAY